MPLPTFIHAGFAKCGSTYLQAYLRQHPDLNYLFKSCFYSPISDCRFDAGLGYYGKLFDDSKSNRLTIESDEHLLMPIFHPTLGVRSVTAESVELVCQRIAATLPGVKMLLVVRNQLEMMVSTYSQYLLGGGTLGLDGFAREFMQCSLDKRNYFAFFYDEIIRSVESHFPGRLKIVLAEDLASSTDEQLESICDFLGVPNHPFQSTFRDRRIGLSHLGMLFVRSLNRVAVRKYATRYEPELWISKGVYKLICNAARVAEHYSGLRKMFQSRQLATPSLVEKMQTTFGTSNQRLGRLLGKDLRSLGYEYDVPARSVFIAPRSLFVRF